MKIRTRWILLGLLLFAASPGCKDEAVCGNGVLEKGEDCDCGDTPEKVPSYCLAPNGHPRSTCSEHCTARPEIKPTVITVLWGITDWASKNVSLDNCSDVGADAVHVVVTGPDGFRVEESRAGCSAYQFQYTETRDHLLAPGTYTVSATLLSGGQPLTQPVTTQGLVAVNTTNIIPILFDLDSFLNREELRGVLLLHLTYDGQSCEDASPLVATEYLSIETEDASLLPGFPTTRACSDSTWRFGDLPVGDLVLDVRGLDSEDATAFCARVPVFIGIGPNMPVDVDVPSGDATTCTQDASGQ